jgi:hypothetical protein
MPELACLKLHGLHSPGIDQLPHSLTLAPSLALCGDDDIYDLRKGSDRASLAWRHGSMKDNTR